MINTRVYIRARATRLQLRPVVREETRVDREREKGSGREEEANRWIERGRSVCACESEREATAREKGREGERERKREIERGAHAGPRRGTTEWRGVRRGGSARRLRRREKRGERRWRYAAQPWEPTAELSSPSHSIAAAAAPAGSRSVVAAVPRHAAPVASPSVVFGLSLYRATPAPRGLDRFFSLLSSSLASAGKRIG